MGFFATMMAGKKEDKKKLSLGSPLLERLHDDVLHLIFEQVFLENFQDLCSTCAVSRNFYLLSVPWLYRNVNIDFSEKARLVLFRRLVRDGSKLPANVRNLELENTDKLTWSQVRQLYLLTPCLTGLETLTWHGFADIPTSILHTLHKNLPRTRFSIHATQIFLVSVPGTFDVQPKFAAAFHNIAIRQLTSFIFHISSRDQVYDNFKFDFVNMLAKSVALKELVIWDAVMLRTEALPETLPLLQGSRLPQLEKLELATAMVIFTNRELVYWGRQNGWEKLKKLSLYDGPSLSILIRQIPSLETLSFYRRDSWDSGETELLLDYMAKAPFGALRKLVYKQGVNSGVLIPWWILTRTSNTISELYISHHRFDNGSVDFPAPSARNVRDLRKMCHGLRIWHLDIMLHGNDWPYPILTELASFDQPITLRLYLHQPYVENVWAFPTRHQCQIAFVHMVNIRKFRNQPMSSDHGKVSSKKSVSSCFTVEFKIVRPWAEMRSYSKTPEYTFWECRDGHAQHQSWATLRVPKQPSPHELSNISNVQFTRLKKKHAFKMAVHSTCRQFQRASPELSMQVWEDELEKKAMEKASQRRKYTSTAQTHLADDETLFDLWT